MSRARALTRSLRPVVPFCLLLTMLVSGATASPEPPLPSQETAEARNEPSGVPVEGSLQQIYRPGLGQEGESTPLAEEERERYLVPPLTLQGTYIGQTAAEPTLGVDKDGTAFFAGSTLVIDTSFAWGVARTDTHRSTDGGLTWESVQAAVPVADETYIPGNADPFVWVDKTTGRVFNYDLTGACAWLNFSDDKGETWLTQPFACGAPIVDHQTIASGPPAPGMTTIGYPSVLYHCSNRLVDTACGRSIDGGLTWTPTGSSVATGGNCSKLHGHLRVDKDGRVFVPMGQCGGNPAVGISANGGDSWQIRTVSNVSSAFPHTSLAVDTEGNVYYTWYNNSTRKPYLSYSTDHGQTWSAPLMVAPPGVNEVNFPVVTAGEPGHVALNFPSSPSEVFSGNARPWNQTVTVTYNLFEDDPIFHSATANDPATNPIHRGNCSGRCAGLWDFLDITTGAFGEVWAAASDDCVGTCNTGAATQAKVGDGLAIRQIGGPCLFTVDPEMASCDPVPEIRWLPEEDENGNGNGG